MLYDGRTGEAIDAPIVVGIMYVLKLYHMVEDKMHARSTGPYSLITQQPLGGKAQFGGQRLGEMECWALQAHGAAHTLQEMLTIKSDDLEGRNAAYEAIVKGSDVLEPTIPESFKVLVKELHSLGLDVQGPGRRRRQRSASSTKRGATGERRQATVREGAHEGTRRYDFSKVQIGSPVPQQIRDWSYGEITKPETINYRTLKPERDGLFDERVFGPEKDWECTCGKYRGQRFAGKVCERCGVEVTKATVRRYRMGHVELATPCAHIWYVKDIPSKVGSLLNLSTSQLEQVLYFAKFIVTDPMDAKLDGRPLSRGDLLSDEEYRQLRYGRQETYSVSQGEDAVVGDGESVEVGQQLAKGVKAKLAGIAQYRFPRKIQIDYRESRDGRMSCPTKDWIEEEAYEGGQPLAELSEDVELASEERASSSFFRSAPTAASRWCTIPTTRACSPATCCPPAWRSSPATASSSRSAT